MKTVAHIRTDFPEKFGVPRQSGLAPTYGRIIFEPEYRNPEALRGLENYSHLWLIWNFSQVKMGGWKATVRPPRLGGNIRIGIWATRSPHRPNPIGLSCVKIEKIVSESQEGPVILVSGADLIDETPIYDLKPYLPYVDCIPGAAGGFSDEVKGYALEVDIPGKLLERIPQDRRIALEKILSMDPRPSYQDDPERIYGMEYAGADIRFQVKSGRVEVVDIRRWE